MTYPGFWSIMEDEKRSFRNAQYTAMADVTTCVCARLQESR